MPQTGIVFSQKRQVAPAWAGAGDVDDCWVVSAIQCANASAPWLALVGVPTFRRHAGDPDDGDHDGGNPHEVYLGVVGSWPAIKPFVREHNGISWDALRARYDIGRPVSLCVIAEQLPARLRYGFTGSHQVSIVLDGTHRFANPLAPAQSRWDDLSTAELANVRDAALAYGKVRYGRSSIGAVTFPTTAEAITVHPRFDSAARAWADAELRSMQSRLTAAEQLAATATVQLHAAQDTAATALEDARAAIVGLTSFVGRFGPPA